MRHPRMKAVMASAAFVALVVAGCGDDRAEVASDDGAEVASGGNLERYCELQQELQSEGDAERIDAVVAAAPPEIAQEMRAVAEAYKLVLETGDHEAAEGVADQEAAMHEFNEQRCGIPNPLDE